MPASYLAPWRRSKHRATIRHMAAETPRRAIPVLQGRALQNTSLQEQLDQRAKPGELWSAEGDDGSVRCEACGHRCLIREGRRGICRVRFNRGGTLFVPSGYAAGVQVDPIEKKPFFHLLPGSDCLTFGMLGCDFHCGYCQNWLTSQALRDPGAVSITSGVSAETLVDLGRQHGARVVASSYNEPLITAEWGMEVFRLARAAGLKTAFVSNGNATPEVLDYIRPWTDGYKIDFKAMQDRAYRSLGGVLQHVLDALRMVHERGFWMEVVTLVVPGFNDADDDLRRMADTLAAISPGIPWHVTAFHQDYKMTDPRNTTVDDLLRACQIGKDAGLRFVYAGNLPGRVGAWEHTWCPDCGDLLIERFGYQIRRQRVTTAGLCPACGARIPGVWS
jgi:pyruvate formate lyase activating enzyme